MNPLDLMIVLDGKVRLLGIVQLTMILLRWIYVVGQLLGWTSLLRASPCEWVTASEDTKVSTPRVLNL